MNVEKKLSEERNVWEALKESATSFTFNYSVILIVFFFFSFCVNREFYYIQMEKYARQAVSEGVKNAEDLRVGGDSEIYRVLNLHYNRNNHIEVWGPQVRKYTKHAHAFYFHFLCLVLKFILLPQQIFQFRVI